MSNINIGDVVRIVSECKSKNKTGVVVNKYSVGACPYVMVKLDGYMKQGFNMLSVRKIGNENNMIGGNNMKNFKNVAIVNLVGDYNKTNYGFALYDEDNNLIKNTSSKYPIYVVANLRGKEVLCVVKKIETVEEYNGRSVTGEVIGVVNMDRYNARVEENNRLKEIKNKKAAIENELKQEINKRKSVEYYEEMAKRYSDNPRLAELVSELKELGNE